MKNIISLSGSKTIVLSCSILLAIAIPIHAPAQNWVLDNLWYLLSHDANTNATMMHNYRYDYVSSKSAEEDGEAVIVWVNKRNTHSYSIRYNFLDTPSSAQFVTFDKKDFERVKEYCESIKLKPLPSVILSESIITTYKGPGYCVSFTLFAPNTRKNRYGVKLFRTYH